MSDRAEWERRHAAQPTRAAPSPFVVEAVRRAAHAFPGGLALDLAAGAGRHTAVLCDAGLRAIALDRARAAVRRLALEIPAARGLIADAMALPFRGPSFAAIVQTCFLERTALPALAGLLRPGGYLIVETFLVLQFERTGHPRREHCLEPGELERGCRALRLEVEAVREADPAGPAEGPCFASIVARRPGIFSF
jgi:SAM-dependent methyltransferase